MLKSLIICLLCVGAYSQLQSDSIYITYDDEFGKIEFSPVENGTVSSEKRSWIHLQQLTFIDFFQEDILQYDMKNFTYNVTKTETSVSLNVEPNPMNMTFTLSILPNYCTEMDEYKYEYNCTRDAAQINITMNAPANYFTLFEYSIRVYPCKDLWCYLVPILSHTPHYKNYSIGIYHYYSDLREWVGIRENSLTTFSGIFYMFWEDKDHWDDDDWDDDGGDIESKLSFDPDTNGQWIILFVAGLFVSILIFMCIKGYIQKKKHNKPVQEESANSLILETR